MALFVAALAFRLAIVFATGMYRDLVRYELERTAISLATRGVYGNPFIVDTGPTAHIVPGYTLLVAAIFKIFGVGVAGEVVKEVLSCIVSSLRCGLLPWIAVSMGIRPRAALIAGCISVFWISALETEVKGGWESPYCALLLLILTARHFLHPVRSQNWTQILTTGVLWGIMLLMNPAMVLVLGGFLMVDLYRERQWFPWPVWRNGAVVAAIAFLILVPWGLRNLSALGSFIPTRSNLGFELYEAYHSGAHWANDAYMQLPNGPHPLHNPAVALRIREMGEVAFNKEKQGLAIGWIRSEPREALRLAFLHFVRFWFPPGRNTVHGIIIAAFTVTGLCGLFILRRTHRELALQLGSILVTYPLIYYVIIWQSRYRYPIEWVLVLLCGVTLASVEARLSGRASA